MGTKERFYHQKLETDEYYFKSPSEMEKIFSRVPQALKNSIEIAEKCNLELNLGKMHLPAYPLPSSCSTQDYLKKLCSEGLKKYYPIPSPEVMKRLQYELKIINQPLIENLIKVGAFDFTAYPCSTLLTLLPLTLKEVKKKEAKDGDQNKISELIASDSIPSYHFSKSFQMNLEKEMLDLYITNHPLKKYDKILAHLPMMNSNQLLNYFRQKTILIRGMLIQARRQFTRQKQVMAFLLLEDEAGFFEVIAFPATY